MRIDELSPIDTPPDGSGNRKGLARRPIPRADDFPYDKKLSYGQPGDTLDRGTSRHEPNHRSLTPKDIEHFSLSLDDVEEVVKEIIGSPILMSRADTSSLGAGTPAGAAGGWSEDPPKSWDPDFTPDVLAIPYGGDEFDYSSRELGAERPLPDMNTFSTIEAHVIADPWDAVQKYLGGRKISGRMPRQSNWDRVAAMVLGRRQTADTP